MSLFKQKKAPDEPALSESQRQRTQKQFATEHRKRQLDHHSVLHSLSLEAG
jgi:hypothetical protein